MYKPIFISYSRKDINRVIPFVKALEKVIGENRIWLDLSGIESGSEFEDRIIKAIDDSEIILFMISDNSMQSVSAKNEVKYAYNKNKKVLPVILDGGGLRDWFLFIFGRINFTDITDPKQVKQLEETLKKTVRTSVDTKYLELARTYLNEHPKEEMYRVSITPIEPVHEDDHYDRLVNFTNKEVACLRFFCEELGYSYQYLSEIKDWQEEQDIDEEHRNILIGALKKMASNDWFWADSVVFTKTDKKYKFRMAIFPHGFDQKPEIHDFVASVKDEDYLRMLALKMSNRHLCFNDLRYYLPNAFDYISLQAEIFYLAVSGNSGVPWNEEQLISVQDFVDVRKDSSCDSFSLAPYAVEMTEVDEDAFTILGEPGLMEEIFVGDFRYTMLTIAERVLSFRMEDERTKLIDRENIDNVNALDVQKAMNVDNYQGILDRFKLDFNGRDGVQIFKKWLDDNGINYSYNESHDVF